MTLVLKNIDLGFRHVEFEARKFPEENKRFIEEKKGK